MLILLLGDCHGRFDLVHRACAEAHDLWGVEAAIQVGDFGFHPRAIHRLMHECRPFPIPVHAIDGNHEDHQWLHERAATDISAWKEIGLHYHARGSVADIGGSRIGFIGGALHADRLQECAALSDTADRVPRAARRPPPTPAWANWVTQQDVVRAVEAFNVTRLDLLVSHSCPAGIDIGMHGAEVLRASVARFITRMGFGKIPITDCGEPTLTQLWQAMRQPPPLWIFGHFHCVRDRVVARTRFVCLGSTDDTDGVAGVRPILYDTKSRVIGMESNFCIAGPED